MSGCLLQAPPTPSALSLRGSSTVPDTGEAKFLAGHHCPFSICEGLKLCWFRSPQLQMTELGYKSIPSLWGEILSISRLPRWGVLREAEGCWKGPGSSVGGVLWEGGGGSVESIFELHLMSLVSEARPLSLHSMQWSVGALGISRTFSRRA